MELALIDKVIYDAGMEAYLIKGHMSSLCRVSLYTTQGNMNVLLRCLGLSSAEELVEKYAIIKKDLSMFSIDLPSNSCNVPCIIDFY